MLIFLTNVYTLGDIENGHQHQNRTGGAPDTAAADALTSLVLGYLKLTWRSNSVLVQLFPVECHPSSKQELCNYCQIRSFELRR